ncbi:hypothetical protein [Actinomadura flavalba]|uniref:hypothetical protein n=1 Tax=Actinomadura flavalba TaxID=1120938 RepID=UPI0003A6ED76|nr:hypothetical protein [Actinomadura flavalba]
MTERSPSAPDPAAHPGSPPAGRAVVPWPEHDPDSDSAELRRTDALLDALAARSAAGSDALPAADPAVTLLRALVADVAEIAPVPDEPAAEPPRGRRRGSRTIVALGVLSTVLGGSGVAAARDGLLPAPPPAAVAEAPAPAPVPAENAPGSLLPSPGPSVPRAPSPRPPAPSARPVAWTPPPATPSARPRPPRETAGPDDRRGRPPSVRTPRHRATDGHPRRHPEHRHRGGHRHGPGDRR